MQNQHGDGAKATNKFAAVMKKIFVHNLGWKLLAIASAVVLWTLAAGLL